MAKNKAGAQFFGLILILALLVFIGFELYVVTIKLMAKSVGQEHFVVLTKDGFFPRQLTIYQGEKVIFSTDKNELYWPASDEHPAHTDYGEFDPSKPLDADETWEFRFTRPGTWGYHDHLYPFHTGTIIVK